MLQLNLKRYGLAALLVALGATPVLAQRAHFGTLALAPGFEQNNAVATGFTNGNFPLSILGRRDLHNNPCIGHGTETPDHILVLEQDFEQLSLQVDSGGNDTTLVVQGPDPNTLHCGDDTGSNQDASVSDRNWKAGTYRIWIGSFEPNQRWNYRLIIQE